ncbi:MAG: OmpA family protein [Spirochaetales bacterium]|nr:OmpA family protein [Spirochaetales bacterium]
MHVRCFAVTFVFLVIPVYLFGQDIIFQYELNPNYTIIERADYSKKVNGAYLGYVNQEVRGLFNSTLQDDGRYKVNGAWYTSREIKNAGRQQAVPLSRIEKSSFIQDRGGNVSGFSKLEGPQFKNFPVFPSKPLKFGDRWEAPLLMIVRDPDGKERAEIPLYCSYQFNSEGTYMELPVYFITAQFALRYRNGTNSDADKIIKTLTGVHKATITISKETLQPILIRDSFQENWTYQSDVTEELKGFNLVFYHGVSLLNRSIVKKQMEDSFGDDDSVRLSEKPEGFTLSVHNLHFIANEATLLDEDKPLLDKLAASLLKIEKKTFLVTGYTANVGSIESQISLSEQRAQTIVQSLIKRGLEPDRFIYIGKGGREPIGDNSTEEGRALNRRVEITILED